MDDEFDRVLSSPKLKGLEQDCTYCTGQADEVATGKIFHDPTLGEEANVRSWFVEYFCPVHQGLGKRWDADTHDVVREVLRDNGIVPID
jgi:hypothetical protein